MALKIEWGNEDKTFIYTRFTPDWTWKEFNINTAEYVDMLKSVDHRVDFVADFTDAPIIPNHFFSNTKRMFNARLENEGYIILVNAGTIIQGIYDVVKRLLPVVEKYVIFVKTMDEALAIVKRDRNGEQLHL